MEVAVSAFVPLLDLSADAPDPRLSEGKLYKPHYVLLFSIITVLIGNNSYRGIATFIDLHRRKFNAAALPTRPINSRRFIRSPRRRGQVMPAETQYQASSQS